MYRKILVPLDGSALAESILPQVESLAGRFDSKVILLRAAGIRGLPGIGQAEAQLRAIREATDYVSGVEAHLRERGLQSIEQAVWYANPAMAILEEADWRKVDLIALCTHGRRLSRLIFGSVVSKVLQSATVPVLLLRPTLGDDALPAGAAPRRILVPLDGTRLAESVLPHVVALAKGMAAAVSLMQVVSPELMADQAMPMMSKALVEDRIRVMDYLQRVQHDLSEQGVVARWVVRGGVPAEQISTEVNIQSADLVAMATHGRSDVGRLIRGSVADAVVRSVDVPVLLVRSMPAMLQRKDEADDSRLLRSAS